MNFTSAAVILFSSGLHAVNVDHAKVDPYKIKQNNFLRKWDSTVDTVSFSPFIGLWYMYNKI